MIGQILLLTSYLEINQELFKQSDHSGLSSNCMNGYILSTSLINLTKDIINNNQPERSLLLFIRVLDLTIDIDLFH
jgi:hypothetical protein